MTSAYSSSTARTPSATEAKSPLSTRARNRATVSGESLRTSFSSPSIQVRPPKTKVKGFG